MTISLVLYNGRNKICEITFYMNLKTVSTSAGDREAGGLVLTRF